MTSCQPQARDALCAAQRSLEDCDSVVTTDVYPPAVGQRQCWTLQVILDTTERVPPAVVAELAQAGLAIALPAQRQGEHALLVALG
jgi:hypothetical protein